MLKNIFGVIVVAVPVFIGVFEAYKRFYPQDTTEVLARNWTIKDINGDVYFSADINFTNLGNRESTIDEIRVIALEYVSGRNQYNCEETGGRLVDSRKWSRVKYQGSEEQAAAPRSIPPEKILTTQYIFEPFNYNRDRGHSIFRLLCAEYNMTGNDGSSYSHKSIVGTFTVGDHEPEIRIPSDLGPRQVVVVP